MITDIIPTHYLSQLSNDNSTYSLRTKNCVHLIYLLSNGEYHSGEKLGQQLGLSRSAIWKAIQDVKALGLEIYSFPNKGYAIPGGIEFLQETQIRGFLPRTKNALISEFSTFLTLDSTNRFLLDCVRKGTAQGHVCLAEYQFLGRGRRGKSWISPFGKNIYLSFLWQFQESPNALASLSLVIGVALIRALASFQLPDLKIKWPNDIYFGSQKLAGVLTEIYIDSVGVCSVVIGIGINLYLSSHAKQQINQPTTAISELSSQMLPRNQMVAVLLEHIIDVLEVYEKEGLSSFLKEWEDVDYLKGQPVQICTEHSEMLGIAQGIDKDGGLRVNIDGASKVFRSGEVSVKFR